MRQNSGRSSWKRNLFEGLLLFGIAGFLFWYFTDFENAHEASRHMEWVIAMLYNLGGKWLVCAVVVAMGIGEILTAVRKLRLMQ